MSCGKYTKHVKNKARHAATKRQPIRMAAGRGDMGTDEQQAGTARRGRMEPPRIKLAELLAGEREAIIEHDGHDYRLRITSKGKLILTK